MKKLELRLPPYCEVQNQVAMNVPNRENRMSELISGPTNYMTNFTHDIDCGWMALPPTAPTRVAEP